jgi:hypothetical protein
MSSSHPIEIPVTHPDQINEIFDTISYAKGGSVLRMLSEALSFETFIKGIRLYLKRHAYGNAVSDDLWTAVAEESKVDIKKLMVGWLGQMGKQYAFHAFDVHILFLTPTDFSWFTIAILYSFCAFPVHLQSSP